MAVRRQGKYAYGYNSKYSQDRRPWKNKSKTDRQKKTLSYFLVFLLSIITVITLLFNAIFITFFSNSKISDALCTNEMYSLVQSEATVGFKEILKPTRIPVSAVTNALDNSYIYQDMKVFLGNSDGIFDKFDMGSRKQLLRQDIIKFYKGKNVEITASLSKNIDSVVDKLLERYTECINLPLWPRFLELRYSVSTYAFVLELVAFAVIALIVIRINVLNRKYIHRFFRYMCESSWTVGLSCIIASVLIGLLHLDIGSQIEQKQYSMIFNSLSADYAKALLLFAVFMLILGFVFFIYTVKARKELVWHCSHRHLSPKDAEAFHQNIAKYIEDGTSAKHEGENDYTI